MCATFSRRWSPASSPDRSPGGRTAGQIYHLYARSLYRALDDEDNRNRRDVSTAVIARRIMALDYLLAHPDRDWLATERDKVERFVTRYDVPHADLPQRVFQAAKAGVPSTTRYFIHKLPIAVDGDPPVASFVYLATEGTRQEFDAFLTDHARLLAWLPAWTVILVGPSPVVLARCEAVFARARRRPVPPAPASLEELRELFAMRQRVDRGDLAGLSVAALHRYPALAVQFTSARIDALYTEWYRRGDAVLSASPLVPRRPAESRGELMIEPLPFDYGQFGSLPGVA